MSDIQAYPHGITMLYEQLPQSCDVNGIHIITPLLLSYPVSQGALCRCRGRIKWQTCSMACCAVHAARHILGLYGMSSAVACEGGTPYADRLSYVNVDALKIARWSSRPVTLISDLAQRASLLKRPPITPRMSYSECNELYYLQK